MTYDQKIELAKSLKPGDAVTLASGFGYNAGAYNNYFGRLSADVVATFKAMRGSDLFVELPKGIEYANQGTAKFPLTAITQ